jgi:hypothetical protein
MADDTKWPPFAGLSNTAALRNPASPVRDVCAAVTVLEFLLLQTVQHRSFTKSCGQKATKRRLPLLILIDDLIMVILYVQ